MNPSKYFNKPVLGKIIVKELNYTIGVQNGSMPGDTFDFISEEESYFICNQWNDENAKRPQLVPKFLVTKVVFNQKA